MVVLDIGVGSLLIGVILAAIMYGFTCMQTWYYYTHYPSDPWHIKLLVAATLVSVTLQQVVITHAVYTYFITNFGVFEELGKVLWSMVAEVVFSAITTFLVQCFQAVRVYRLSKKSWLATGSVMMVVTTEFLVAMIFCVKASGLRTFVQLTTLKSLSITNTSLAAAGDIFIALVLCYLLQASRTGFRRSETLINKLIVFSISTGLLTSFFALATLVSICMFGHTSIYAIFFFSVGSLYCNSLLATLNMRERLRSQSNGEDVSLSLQSRGTQQKTDHSMIGSPRRMPNNISIKVDTTQEYIREEYSSSSGDSKIPEVV